MKSCCLILFWLILVKIAWKDQKDRQISHRDILAIFSLGLFFLGISKEISWMQRGIETVLTGILGIMFYMGTHGAIGAGDVRLITVSALILGGEGILYGVFMAAVLAGMYFLYGVFQKKIEKHQEIAFGPFLSIGMIGISCYIYWI